MDTIAPRLRAHVNDRIPRASRLAVENLILAHQSERERIHQRVSAVAGLELRLTAEVWHTKAVAITRDAAHHTLNDGMVLRNQIRPSSGFRHDRPEAQRIHHSQRPRAHSKDVAQNATNPRRRPLIGLNVTGVIVALDLEGAGPTVAHVDDASILTRPLHHAIAFRGQPLQVNTARLIRAVLAPHHAVNSQFRQRWNASQRRKNALVLVRSDAVLCKEFRRNRNRLGNNCRGGRSHHDCLHCRMGCRTEEGRKSVES